MPGFHASWGCKLNGIPGFALDTLATLDFMAGELAALEG